MTSEELTVRQATPEDYDDVAAFTSEIWTDRSGDYIPQVYHDWIAGDGDTQRTFVVDTGDDVGGICQAVLLSEHEAWLQGMRSNPEFRGEGIAGLLNEAAFDWAAEKGATVARNMVFSWNDAGLGASRDAGFEPGIEFRWAHPDPREDALAGLDTDATVENDPDAAWTQWMGSDGRDVLGGLALDDEESWALRELTRDTLHDASDDAEVFSVQDDGTTAMAFRVRDYDRENDDGEDVHWAEYGAATWDDTESARVLFAAIAEDAAALGADETRVLIPESTQHVTDAAYTRAGISDEPKFALECDLTDRR
ncbi:GNAT family N-acetyltransferase [Halobacterium litoreum]|uniref:GNAT family N-acetyltransferase n=1 Tax=Halobacterium litoreum TaxID=2039234 RepID=A0ABD5NDH2_9EURY|nr:GNAT family N-acetyltransferase [Halobacterium litoreum]UHH13819.1 GNAT family N-acetyltransferase [Halobacterium litoreum]